MFTLDHACDDQPQTVLCTKAQRIEVFSNIRDQEEHHERHILDEHQ